MFEKWLGNRGKKMGVEKGGHLAVALYPDSEKRNSKGS